MATLSCFSKIYVMNGIKSLLDTNLVIGLLKGHAPAITLAEQAGLTLAQAGISQITRMELLGYPRLTLEEERQIRVFMANCRVFFIDETTELEAIRLHRTGAFKLPDAIVAATAIIHRLQLLTLDQGMLNALKKTGHEPREQ